MEHTKIDFQLSQPPPPLALEKSLLAEPSPATCRMCSPHTQVPTSDEVREAGSHFEAGRRTVDGQNLAPFQNAALATRTGLPLPHPLHV